MREPDLNLKLNSEGKTEVEVFYDGGLVRFSWATPGESGGTRTFEVSKEELSNLVTILNLLEDKPNEKN